MKKGWLIVFVITLSSCAGWLGFEGVDSELWRFWSEIPLSKMKYTKSIRTNGYYESSSYEGQILFNRKRIYFFDNGYVGITRFVNYPTFTKNGLNKQEKEELKKDGWLHWGRYIIETDTLTIQYISNTVLGRGWLFFSNLTVHEGKGIVLSDTTFCITEITYHDKANVHGKGRGIQKFHNIAPIYFRFVESETPPSDNWIMNDEELTRGSKGK